MDKQIQKIIEKSKNHKEIIAVALFGSYSRGEQRKNSEVDICLFLDKKYSNLKMSKIRLNFLKNSPNNFDVQIFQQLPVYIRTRILKEKKYY